MHRCRKLSLVVAILLILSTAAFAEEALNGSDFTQGMIDGKRDGQADASLLWVGAGIGCGCLGVIGAYVFPGSIPVEKLIGRSSDYARGYSETYKSARVNRQALYAGAGWLTWAVFYLVYYSSTTV